MPGSIIATIAFLLYFIASARWPETFWIGSWLNRSKIKARREEAKRIQSDWQKKYKKLAEYTKTLEHWVVLGIVSEKPDLIQPENKRVFKDSDFLEFADILSKARYTHYADEVDGYNRDGTPKIIAKWHEVALPAVGTLRNWKMGLSMESVFIDGDYIPRMERIGDGVTVHRGDGSRTRPKPPSGVPESSNGRRQNRNARTTKKGSKTSYNEDLEKRRARLRRQKIRTASYNEGEMNEIFNRARLLPEEIEYG